MYDREKAILEKELKKYKYMLYKASNPKAGFVNKDKKKFIKTMLDSLEAELKAISKWKA